MDELFEKWDSKNKVWLKRLFSDGVRHYTINNPDALLKHVIHQIELHSKSRKGSANLENYLQMIDEIKNDSHLFRMYCEGIIERENYFEKNLKFAKIDSKKASHRAALAIMKYILEELPNFPHHKPTTKSYQHSFNYFTELLEGRFISRKKSLLKFIDDRKLSSELLSPKMFKIGEIKETLKLLDTKREKGLYKNLSLQSMLFNNADRWGSSSMFLTAWNELNKKKIVDEKNNTLKE